MNKMTNHNLKTYINKNYKSNTTDIDFPKLYIRNYKNKIDSELEFYVKSLNTINTSNLHFLKLGEKIYLNDLIVKRFSLKNGCYQYGINKKDNALVALLYILDNSLINEDEMILNKYIYHLRNKMGMELDTKKYFQIYEYRKHKYKKCDMKDTLLNYKPINDDILHYFADYFKINIIIINHKIQTNYRVVNTYCKDRGNCYLIEFENNLYQPILNDLGDNIHYQLNCVY